MKHLVTAISAAFVAISLGSVSALADSHEEVEKGPSFVPVETWACNFHDGKSLSDLMAFTKKFNAWLDDEGYTDYFAAVVTPNYYGEKKMDVGWLGAWANGNAMGSGTDMWLADGGELAAEFTSIVHCGAHTQFASMMIKMPPDDDSDDKNFVLDFTNCSAKDGVEFDSVLEAMDTWAKYQEEHGFKNGTWIMFPIFGESDSEYGFKVVNSHASYTTFGAGFELMGNGGHWRKSSELFDSLLDCDIARVYNATQIREMTSED
jgi:hypothetical protein